MTIPAFFGGLSVLLSLIVAIGAQNAFVLRQGLCGEHVLVIVLLCAGSDAVLIAAGVTGFGALALRAPWLDPAMRWGGAAFLSGYGALSLRSALRSQRALTSEASPSGPTLGRAVLTCLAMTWANPHVYLDTIVLVGAISTQYPNAKAAFAAGAVTGSLLFFLALGYGARALKPIFATPSAWRAFEAATALVMWRVSFGLIANA